MDVKFDLPQVFVPKIFLERMVPTPGVEMKGGGTSKT
jgi:hypothetical protein